MRWAVLLTVTTREPSTGSMLSSSCPVSAKWPRWLVPNCSSKPSLVVAARRDHHAGVVDQQIDARIGGAQLVGGGADRVQRGQVELLHRDVGAGTLGGDAAAASLPLSRLRTASTTCAPLAARTAAVSYPMPVLEPVTMATRPDWSGTSASVHLVMIETIPTRLLDAAGLAEQCRAMRASVGLLVACLIAVTGCASRSEPADVDALSGWNDGPAKKSITEFVDRVTTPDTPDFVPEAERIAVFDNDGTLWPEAPVPFQGAFVFDELKRRAPTEPATGRRPDGAGGVEGGCRNPARR